MLKSDVVWPNSRRYKSHSEWEPIGFFSDCLCNATRFDLKLGFFSTSAINVLSDGFAAFLYNGGRMRLIINDVLSQQDKNILNKAEDSSAIIPAISLNDIAKLKETLSQRGRHFFDCIAWLIRNNRIEIKIVTPKDSDGISHTKCGLFADATNKVAFDGSCNFSRTALIENVESITAFCDWDSPSDKFRIEDVEEDFLRTFNGEDNSVEYLDSSAIRTSITSIFPDKSIKNLLEEEVDMLQNSIISDYPISVKQALSRAKEKVDAVIKRTYGTVSIDTMKSRKPCFPYPSGPRDYQILAFKNWKDNKQKGLFAMATGTGKTITSLNCLLEIYKKLGYYKALILVPTITLVEQWEKECHKFNFENIIKVCSKYKGWQTSLANIRMLEMSNADNKISYVIISTYASFIKPNNFLELNLFPKKKLLLIADEAHNMGAGLVSMRLNDIAYLRRIGLSATPERQFDEDGNARLASFFGCENGYTFEYSMAEAIRNGALCKYYYYPHLVELTTDEMSQYGALSKKIATIINREDDESKEILKRLLLKRKQIIHKAENKKQAFKNILIEHLNKTGSLKYTLVYVPEGNQLDDQFADIFDRTETIRNDEDTIHLIDEYTRIVKDIDPHIIVRQFTSESSDRDLMLSDFANGSIDVLTSMKCLDEGVDVPRSELAVFCASTGNPRQFIQRRGRVLRTHKDKHFAIIHDLVVVPDVNYDESCYELEKSLVSAELKRVRNFALLSENCNDTLNALDNILERYQISLFS